MTPEEQDIIRRRQRGRTIVTALLLLGFVVLLYFVTIAKITAANG